METFYFIYGSKLTKDEVIDSLAACIKLASIAAGGDMSSTNDIYWYTREKCFTFIQELKGLSLISSVYLIPTWSEVLKRVQKLAFEEEIGLKKIAGHFWMDFIHPHILVSNVLNN